MSKSLLRTETVRYAEAEITVETACLFSELLKFELAARLEKVVTREANYVLRYAEVVTRQVKVSGLGFALPEPDAPEDAHVQAFNAYMRLPVPLISDLIAALDRLNTPPNSKPGIAAGAPSDDPKADAQDKTTSAA